MDDSNIEYALCEGLAVAVHGYPRVTKDIDILVLEKDLPRVVELVAGLQYDLEGGYFKFHPGTPQESQMYRISRAEGHDLVMLDLMIVSPVLLDVWKERELIAVDSSKIKVVSFEGLLKMKQMSGRPQDIADIDALKRIHEPDNRMLSSKDRARGASTDMNPAAVAQRLAIVDELREFALELRQAKKLGKVEDFNSRLSSQQLSLAINLEPIDENSKHPSK